MLVSPSTRYAASTRKAPTSPSIRAAPADGRWGEVHQQSTPISCRPRACAARCSRSSCPHPAGRWTGIGALPVSRVRAREPEPELPGGRAAPFPDRTVTSPADCAHRFPGGPVRSNPGGRRSGAADAPTARPPAARNGCPLRTAAAAAPAVRCDQPAVRHVRSCCSRRGSHADGSRATGSRRAPRHHRRPGIRRCSTRRG